MPLDLDYDLNGPPALDAAPPPARYLGPATVVTAAGRRVRLELPACRLWAEMALAQAYEPVAGDTVLAIGEGGAWYVIGVIQGRGRTTITVPGDLALLAPKGEITLAGGKGVRVRGPVVRIIAGRLSLAADRLVERLGEVRRRVRGLLDTRSGQARWTVEETWRLAAGRVAVRAAGEARLDGEQIKLG